MRTNQKYFGLMVLALAAVTALGQESVPQQSTPQSSGGWRRATESDTRAQTASAVPAPAPAPAPEPRMAPAPTSGGLDAFGQPRGAGGGQERAPMPQRSSGTYVLPSELTVPNGTFVTVRIDQELSSTGPRR